MSDDAKVRIPPCTKIEPFPAGTRTYDVPWRAIPTTPELPWPGEEEGR